MYFFLTLFLTILTGYDSVSGQCKSPEYDLAKQWVDYATSEAVSRFLNRNEPLTDAHASKYQRLLHNATWHLGLLFGPSFTFQKKTYRLSRYLADDFYHAQIVCTSYGAILTEVNGQKELHAIRDFMKLHWRIPCLYIGKEQYPDGEWYYLSSGKPAYAQFGDSLDGDRRCATLWQRTNWLMDDIACGLNCHFLCEFNK